MNILQISTIWITISTSTTQKGTMMKIIEIYKQQERYNSRIKATVSGAWMAVLSNGDEFPICRDYEAKDAAHARLIYEEDQKQSSRFDFTNRIDR
jgi:hypothetical protein